MATLWQLLFRKKPTLTAQAVEHRLYNPLQAKVGSIVKIKTIDLEHLTFRVDGVDEIKTTVNGKDHYIGELRLIARDDEGVIRKRLRLVPIGNADSRTTHDVILLNHVADFDYDADYHKGLAFSENGGECVEPAMNKDGTPQIDSDGQPIYDKFWRVGDCKEPWDAEMASLRDEDRSGKIEEDEVTRSRVTFWDFHRDFKSDAVEQREFYIVEKEGKPDQPGFFSVWRGVRIDPNRVIL